MTFVLFLFLIAILFLHQLYHHKVALIVLQPDFIITISAQTLAYKTHFKFLVGSKQSGPI